MVEHTGETQLVHANKYSWDNHLQSQKHTCRLSSAECSFADFESNPVPLIMSRTEKPRSV